MVQFLAVLFNTHNFSSNLSLSTLTYFILFRVRGKGRGETKYENFMCLLPKRTGKERRKFGVTWKTARKTLCATEESIIQQF